MVEISLREQLVSPKITSVGLPVFSITLMLFFLFQGPLIFGADIWEHWQSVTFAYILMVIVAFVFELRKHEHPAWIVLGVFGATTAGMFLLFSLTFRAGFTYDSGFPLGDAVPTIVYQLFVISFAEEIFFRGFLTERIRVLPSAAAFSGFHLLAYSVAGLNITAFVVAFIMGLALGFVYLATKKFSGIAIPWGIHAAYNLALLFA